MKAKNKSHRIRLLSICFLCLTLANLFMSCAARRHPDLARVFEVTGRRVGKRPIIVIPGILGSKLVNKRTGETAWPSAFRSKTDTLALPVSPDLKANRDELEPSQILDTAQFARLTPAVRVYAQLLDALQNYGGYRRGDWNSPPPDGDRDTFYVFAYDWRRDNVETAAEFLRRTDELKRKLNRPDLRFNIIAHSMGGLIARYAAMYGESDLPEDEKSPALTWTGARDINKIFMFGVPNEGSMEAFTTLLDGYSVTEGLRPRVRLLNKLNRDDVLTAPALFQLLPHEATARFLDENLQELKIDLYDAVTWRKYGWSALYDSKPRRAKESSSARADEMKTNANEVEKMASGGASDSRQTLEAYFVAALRRAKLFQNALDAGLRQSARAPVALYAFGGDCEETLAAPIIRRDAKTGETVTQTRPQPFDAPNGHRYTRAELIRAMYEPGDGRVTRRSLLATTPPFDGLPFAYVVFACDIHSDLQNNLILQDNALTQLIEEAMK